MFTGLVEAVGKVRSATNRGGGRLLVVEASFAPELKVGDSVAVSGVCLTVTALDARTFTAEAVAATVKATTLGNLRSGSVVNLERALRAGDRLGGHFVQGHVDEVGAIRRITRGGDYWTVAVGTDRRQAGLLVERGSVCVDGVSLTAAAVKAGEFTVNIIPHTWANTTFHLRRVRESVNIEYDLLVKAARGSTNPV
ncbi:MAG: riboflavin synthase [bacterium]